MVIFIIQRRLKDNTTRRLRDNTTRNIRSRNLIIWRINYSLFTYLNINGSLLYISQITYILICI